MIFARELNMHLPTLNELSPERLKRARVLVRIHASGAETFLPTLRYLLDAGARVILATDLSNAAGTDDDGLSLTSTAMKIEFALGRPVHKLSTAVGGVALRAVGAMSADSVVVLENLALYPEE